MDQAHGILTWLRKRADDLVVLLLASMFFTFLVQIVYRYVLNLPLGWTVEYVSIAWLWGILFGYAFVLRDEDIIRIDLLYSAVPDGVRRAMAVVANLICAGIMAWSLPATWDYISFMKVERTASLLIRFDVLFAVYVPFVVSVIIRCLIETVNAIRGERIAVNTYGAEEVETHV